MLIPLFKMFVFIVFLFVPFLSAADDAGLQERIDALEKKVSELNERLKEKEEKTANETVSSFKISGEYRNRAQIEVNTVNNYTNTGGTTLHAYEKGATTTHDYGWWDHRLQLNTETIFYSDPKLIVDLEIEDAVWGNQSAQFEGESGSVDKFDDVEIAIKQLYMDIGIYPLRLRGRMGRQDMQLGNGLIFGNRHDGFRFYYPGEVWEIGIMHTRQWEGENAEMTSSLNDDEDTYMIYGTRKSGELNLDIFGLLDRMHVSKSPGDLYDFSPLYLLPNFTQEDYESQEHFMAAFGAALGKRFEKVTVKLEGDYVWGTVYASNPAKDDIQIGGFALFGKLDYRQSETSRIALSAGYGSGDDPDTDDYEGFFAPDNNFGTGEGYAERYIGKYMEVYEYLSPGAGVPGMLAVKPGQYPIGTNKGFYNFGTGGLENTTFAMLSWDYKGLPRHRFYFGGAYLRASEPNPDTDSAEIGVEIDGLVEYYFMENVNFALYGGHLFMLGDYFGKNAGDAANLVGEFRIRF